MIVSLIVSTALIFCFFIANFSPKENVHKPVIKQDTTYIEIHTDVGRWMMGRAYEYRMVDHDMFDENEIWTMNNLGAYGWEIIRILEPMKYLNSEGMFVRIYYKREKEQGSEQN
jgi:hypothetical protein